ncbi:hypothetical protein [Fictibacillus enclensis]|uniref:hypothetical protein n=1 Tax=Fictibacillus enclensis TaxID=1017270 RepID=UPI0024C00F08|nr:hypothetical protein [Fictibacillus enclensis]WHY73436.1 hypothetical protein QNH15_05860 [Fictibacillus enclensis]
MQWTYDQYRDHQSFESVALLNEAVRQHLYCNASELNKTAATVLKTISRYSCVIPGVSWLKVGTLAGIIDKSEKTVRRALKALEAVGAIKRIPTIRKRGGRGYDICVILPVDHAKVSSRSAAESTCETKAQRGSELEETLIHKSKRIRISDLNHTYVRDFVPDRFKALVASFWDNAKVIEEYYRMALIAGHKAFDRETITNAAIAAFKQMIGTLKTGRVRNKVAYYYGVLSSKLDDLYYEQLHAMGYEPSVHNDIYNEYETLSEVANL